MKKETQNQSLFQRFWGDQGGATSVVFIAGSLAIGSALAVGVDMAIVHKKHQNMQVALDAAVLAAAHHTDQESSVLQAYGRSIFDYNFDGSHAVTDFSLSYDGQGKVSAEAKMQSPLVFGSLIGRAKENISAQSYVMLDGLATEGGTQANGPACIITLGDKARALTMNSDAVINAQGCEMHITTTAEPGISHQSHASLSASRVCLAASTVLNNGDPIENLETDCITNGNPYAGLLPIASTACTHFGENHNGGEHTLSPGVYCGSRNFNGSPDVTLEPGLYVIKDSKWNISGGSWSGQGVTFYFASKQAGIQFNSDVSVDIKAPETGDYKGILMMEAEGLGKSNCVLNPSDSFEAEGLIYLPSRNMTLNSQSSVTGRQLSLVVNELLVNGASFNIIASDNLPLAASSGTSQIVQSYAPRISG